MSTSWSGYWTTRHRPHLEPEPEVIALPETHPCPFCGADTENAYACDECSKPSDTDDWRLDNLRERLADQRHELDGEDY